MPLRRELDSVLILGSGPIVIGQACEFDYAGTQAVSALRQEGVRVSLLNSNPATIMTDPDLADATYVEPLTVESVEAILERERPRGLLPTLGGQTALNLAVACARAGLLDRFGVELLGVSEDAIYKAEDRARFKTAMERIGLSCPRSAQVSSVEAARTVAGDIGFPVILRPSFTLGGSGGGIVRQPHELDARVAEALRASPVGQVLVEESVIGWKEFELEVVRDARDNCIVVCAIENIDPMGVHTGDSITVAPAMTLTDKEYQRMRDAAFAVMREIGVTTGGSNVQFAVEPGTGRLLVIEMNPRVSRSSALASKATGFPIARVAAKLALGYELRELANDITRVTPASFEPTIDYVVVKWPRFTFEKFEGAPRALGTQMKSVGEAMAIGRTFSEALGKALRSLEIGRAGFDLPLGGSDDLQRLERAIQEPTAERPFQLGRAFQLGLSVARARELTAIDPWFLHQWRGVALAELAIAQSALGELAVGGDPLFAATDGGVVTAHGLGDVLPQLRNAKRLGVSDRRIATLAGTSEAEVRKVRWSMGLHPVYKAVDTCAAELEARTEYFYSSYEDETEVVPSDREKVIVLGGGPNRIGQGIEFDYCCVHASMALRDEGVESVMVNCNPETVSTDFDISDRLYFEPLTLEDVLEICRVERARGVIVQLGGQTPLGLAKGLAAEGIPILGTPPEAIDRAEDRERFAGLISTLGLLAPPWGIARSLEEARRIAVEVGFPVIIRPSYVLGGRAMQRIDAASELDRYFQGLIRSAGKLAESTVVGLPLLIDRFLSGGIEVDVEVLCDGHDAFVAGVMEHVEEAGIHSGDSACALPPYSLDGALIADVERQARAIAIELGVIGLMNVQMVVCDQDIYVLEVNPRASRTIPFLSKATGRPLAKLATRVMLGRKLHELGLDTPPRARCSVKEVVLPFNKFDVDPILGPEMRSTGEVIGMDDDFPRAYAKAQIAAGNPLPSSGRVIVAGAPEVANDVRALGFELAPANSAAIASRSIALVIAIGDENAGLAREAVRAGVPYITTRRAAQASLAAISALRVSGFSHRPLQELSAKNEVP